MDLLTVMFVIVVVGVALWLVNTYVTIMDAKIKTILNIVVVFGLILWLCRAFGLFDALSKVKL